MKDQTIFIINIFGLKHNRLIEMKEEMSSSNNKYQPNQKPFKIYILLKNKYLRFNESRM